MKIFLPVAIVNKILFLFRLFNRLNLLKSYLDKLNCYLNQYKLFRKVIEQDIVRIKRALVKENNVIFNNLVGSMCLNNFIG